MQAMQAKSTKKVKKSEKSSLRRLIPAAHPPIWGFTLVEILVVLTVIAILIALIAPSIGGVKHQSVGLHCLSNIRSTTTTIELYANDYKDMLPFAGYDERTVVAPGNPDLTYLIGSTRGVEKGTWALLFADDWAGQDWNHALTCPAQPKYDPDVKPLGTSSLTDGQLQLSTYDMSLAFWIDPKSLAAGSAYENMRVRPARFGDVTFPSEKALLFEQIGFCIDGPDAQWSINEWGQTPYNRTSVAAVDGSALRMKQADGLPAIFTWPFDATVDGVHGRDIPRSTRTIQNPPPPGR